MAMYTQRATTDYLTGLTNVANTIASKIPLSQLELDGLSEEDLKGDKKLVVALFKAIEEREEMRKRLDTFMKAENRVMPHDFRLRVDEMTPSHVRFTVFAGPDKEATHANCGRLCMDHGEFRDFCKILEYKDGDTTVEPIFRDLKVQDLGLEL